MRRKIFPSDRDRQYRRWLASGGDDRYRFTYPLTTDSIVLDIGGYMGQWASDIYSRYLCRVHIAEPVPAFADVIRTRFKHNPHIFVHQFALGASDRKEQISIGADSSSTFLAAGNRVEIEFRDIKGFIATSNLNQVDLLKVNCEGGEYELLERMIECDLHEGITDLQIQFHEIENHSRHRRAAIQHALSKTHNLTYDFPFLWENWCRK